MAELTSSAGANRHAGIARSKKLSTRVDLTPMVDLGFLLITFFVFTTTLSQPSAMQLFMPAGEVTETEYADSKVLTMIPVSGDSVVYYHGEPGKAQRQGLYGITSFSVTEGIGAVIRKKQQALEAHPNFSKRDLVLIIRPGKDSRYQNVIDAMDEVLINQVAHYSFVDLTDEETAFLRNIEHRTGNRE